jgi:hypothetical protein
MKRFLKTRFVLIICLTLGLGLTLSGVAQAQEEPLQGCSPGFWKHDKHFDSWPAPYTPEMLFSDVFGVVIQVKFKEKGVKGKPPLLNNPTLLQALRAKGGKVNALARQAVAALLNAASPDVNYPIELGMVFMMVNDALSDTTGESIEAVKNIFETNNELVCPLNGDDV